MKPNSAQTGQNIQVNPLKPSEDKMPKYQRLQTTCEMQANEMQNPLVSDSNSNRNMRGWLSTKQHVIAQHMVVSSCQASLTRQLNSACGHFSNFGSGQLRVRRFASLCRVIECLHNCFSRLQTIVVVNKTPHALWILDKDLPFRLFEIIIELSLAKGH